MKIDFRKIEPKDLLLIMSWRNQERIRKNSRSHKSLNMKDQESWFERISASQTDRIFLVVWDANPVGVCGLSHIDWDNRSAEISYYLGVQSGPASDVAIGVEVYEFLKKKGFVEYKLNRLYGEAFSFNQGGVELALNCGFKQEGVKRQVTFWDGRYWDGVIVAMLDEEYRNKRSN